MMPYVWGCWREDKIRTQHQCIYTIRVEYSPNYDSDDVRPEHVRRARIKYQAERLRNRQTQPSRS